MAETKVEATVQPAVKSAPKAAPVKSVLYQTREKHGHLIDIQVRGHIIRGVWDKAHERVQWDVPSELAALFEQHFHVKSGLIVKA